MRHPVSSLALGPGAVVQTANFAVAGALYLAGAVGLARSLRDRVLPALVGATGLGLISSGVFATDPISGYPPGSAADPAKTRTSTGKAHDLSAVPIFLGLPAAAVVHARRELRAGRRGRALGSASAAAGTLVALSFSSAGFAQKPTLVEHGGTLQRLSITTIFAWLSALFVRSIARL